MKEISIEEKVITHHTIHVEFFLDNSEQILTRPLKVLEDWLVENKLLDWHSVVMVKNEHIDDRDGEWQFGDFIAEKLNDDTLEKFVRHELEK